MTVVVVEEEVTEKTDDSKMETEYVFVYGSLKRGGHFNHALADAEFIQEAMSRKQKYSIISPNDQWPILKRGNYRIKGEIFKIDENIRKRLDWIEGHPNLFVRKMFSIHGFGHKVYVYVGGDRILETYDGLVYDSPRVLTDRYQRTQEWLIK